jgi:hypothetical protein
VRAGGLQCNIRDEMTDKIVVKDSRMHHGVREYELKVG